jgi:hypothetical protein
MFQLPSEFTPFLDQWNDLPRDSHAVLPQRTDISPVTFGPFLPLMCIAEFMAQRHMQIVYAGSEFERLAGFSPDVENYYDLLADDFADAAAVFHRIIRDAPCGAFIGDVITTTSGARYLHETLHLPLADEAGMPRYLLIYGVGRKPAGENGTRTWENHRASQIKELHYLDLGAGAPTQRVENFKFCK